jgi:hypothetical protein
MTGQAGRTKKKKKFGGEGGRERGRRGDITNPKFAFVFPLSKFLITAAASRLHPSFPARSLARSLVAAVAAAAPVAARRPNQCGVFVYTFLWCSPTELSSAHDLPSNFVSLGTVTKSSLFLLLRNNFVVSAPQKFCCFCFSEFFFVSAPLH